MKKYVTKSVAADEAGAHVEPRKAMSILTCGGKPLQSQDNLFMTEWVAIFKESGLRDDVTIQNLQDTCLKLANGTCFEGPTPPPPPRNYCISSSLRIIVCNGRDLTIWIYIKTPTMISLGPRILDVMAHPINYTQTMQWIT